MWGSLRGHGVEWECKTCGKHSSTLLNGVGVCCSPELQEQERRQAQHEQEKRDLLWALRSRPLTDEEMGRVAAHDYSLLVIYGVSYNETEVRRQFGDMLVNQFRLRAIAAEGERLHRSEVSEHVQGPEATIPGWKTAIFKDADGRPYWRSDGRPLTDPQPETENKA